MFDLSGVREQLRGRYTVPTLHVTGTNGKGTVVFVLSSLLSPFARIGSLTSPYIFQAREAVCVNNEPVDRESYDRVYATTTGSDFEREVITGFLLLQERQCDLVVAEMGIGCPVDATLGVPKNVRLGLVITSISLDHCSLLGSTVEDIAHTKTSTANAGTAVYIPSNIVAKHVIMATAAKRGCSVVDAPCCYDADQSNYALAVCVAAHISRHLSLRLALPPPVPALRIPGCLEQISQCLWIDKAHNAAALWNLRKHMIGFDLIVLAFSRSKDRPLSSLLEPLTDVPTQLCFAEYSTEPGSAWRLPCREARACAEALESMSGRRVPHFKSLEAALAHFQDVHKVLVTGSVYMLASARRQAGQLSD